MRGLISTEKHGFMLIKTPFLKRFSLLASLLMSVFAGVFYFVADISVLDLSSGFSHPLEGWDHVVTMLGVGIWAAQLRGKAIWLLPTTFVGVMSLGGISGAAKYLAVPSAEILIVLSCLVFSFLIIRKVRFDTRINVLIVAFFAFFHGYAHGAEISTSASLISYTLGFMIATLLLHGAGILVAKVVLISIAFFIAQALNVVGSTETIKNVSASYSQIAKSDSQQRETFVEKSPQINLSPQWLNLSPPLESILFAKTYFVFSTLLLVFTVSQFVCYVFYLKQRPDFVCYSKFLARCFKNTFASPLTLLRSNPLFSISNPNVFKKRITALLAFRKPNFLISQQ
jgi:hydrogenase/urease accessory protein HupE